MHHLLPLYRHHPRGIHGHQQLEVLVPPQATGPADVRAAGEPPVPAVLGVADGHSRGIDGPVGAPLGPHRARQVQGDLLDEARATTHQAVELGAVGQGGESVEEVLGGVAVEVPLASEAPPAGEEGQGDDLALGEGRLGPGTRPLRREGVAEVVDDDVECSEEGVRVERGGRFLSLRDRSASRP